MTKLINRELFIINLTAYMLNTVSGIKGANKETQKRWISEIRHYVPSEYLNPSFNKFYPDKTNAEGVALSIVWDDIINAGKWNAIQILSDIDEIYDRKADFQENALLYLMNAFVLENPTGFKVFSN